MLVDLPPPPARITTRIEASFHVPAAPPPYAYRLVGEGAPSEDVPARQVYRTAGLRGGSAGDRYALANPINLVLERLGASFRTLCLEIRDKTLIWVPAMESSTGGDSGGLGDESPNPVPAGDPIPVGGGGNPGGPTGG